MKARLLVPVRRLPALLLVGCLLLLPLTGEPPGCVTRCSGEAAVILAFVGDVMLGRGVAVALDGDWGVVFAGVRPWLADADVAFANLESPLTTAPLLSGGYDLRASPEAAVALRSAGFDVLSLANNHALDAGEAGRRETAGTLRAAGVDVLLDGGAEDWRAGIPACRSTSEALGPQALCFLSYDDSVVPIDLEAAVQTVSSAARRADVVVVSVHWGGEYQAAPSPRQQAVARALADAGARIIVGHGPHVLQRVEWVGETLVAYSLGNFLFDQPYPADCSWGAILRVALDGGRNIVAVKALPTVVERGRVRPAGPEDAAAILARLKLEPEI